MPKGDLHKARPAHTYRAARRNEARKRKLLWRELPRRQNGHWAPVTVVLPPAKPARSAA